MKQNSRSEQAELEYGKKSKKDNEKSRGKVEKQLKKKLKKIENKS